MGVVGSTMGVLTAIKKNLNEAGQEKKPVENTSANIPDCVFQDPPAKPPCPCLECWSPTFWHTVYDTQLRCAICDPWPSLSLVGSRWTLYTHPDGSLEWIACLRRGERAMARPLPAVASDEMPGWVMHETDDEDGTWWTLVETGERSRCQYSYVAEGKR